MSAILFIYYLGCCLQKEKQLIAAPELLVTPKFADDITYIAREKETIEKVEKVVPTLLKEYNLQINNRKNRKIRNTQTTTTTTHYGNPSKTSS